MTTASRRSVLSLTVNEGWSLLVMILLVGLYCLAAYAVQSIKGSLEKFWFNSAVAIAQGSVLAGAFSACLICLREIHALQNRLTPSAHVQASVTRLFRNLAVFSVGQIPLMVISHMGIQVPEVVESPWTLPAFVCMGVPFCMLSAIACFKPWPWWMKSTIWLLTFAYVATHKAVALAWGVTQGAWLLWMLFAGGIGGLLWGGQILLKTAVFSWRDGPRCWHWWNLWTQHWAERPLLLNPQLAGVVPALIGSWVGRFFNHPDFPESLVSNYFWSGRVTFLVLWMFTLLRSERAHWRWQMLPGSGFRMQLGNEMALCTARYMAWDLTIGLALIAVFWWFWEPYAFADVLRTVELLAWPMLVDFSFGLGCAVWLRSLRWRSAPDMTAMCGLLLVIWLSLDLRFWGARSWFQDGLMLGCAWLMVLRANKNFETSNWSWGSHGRRMGWMSGTGKGA